MYVYACASQEVCVIITFYSVNFIVHLNSFENNHPGSHLHSAVILRHCTISGMQPPPPPPLSYTLVSLLYKCVVLGTDHGCTNLQISTIFLVVAHLNHPPPPHQNQQINTFLQLSNLYFHPLPPYYPHIVYLDSYLITLLILQPLIYPTSCVSYVTPTTPCPCSTLSQPH